MTDELPDDIPDRPLHYDRSGRPIGLATWARLMDDEGYRVVEQTHIGRFWISTVWLGTDHNFGLGPPMIFETMVFDATVSDRGRSGPRSERTVVPAELEMRRYSTIEQARAGHADFISLVKTIEALGAPGAESVRSDAEPPPAPG